MVLWRYDKAPGLILPSTLISQPILMKLSMNANIKKAQFHYFLKYDLKGN